MARKRKWDDDDGRTIASMSDVGRPNIFFPGKITSSDSSSSTPKPEETDDNSSRPWEMDEGFSRQERGWYVLGALRAALLIGLAFIVGLGAVILLMVLVWS